MIHNPISVKTTFHEIVPFVFPFKHAHDQQPHLCKDHFFWNRSLQICMHRPLWLNFLGGIKIPLYNDV